MKPLRRSQRLRTQPSSQRNGQEYPQVQANGYKRNHIDDETPREQKSKRYRLTEKNLARHGKDVKAMGRTRKVPTNSPSSGGGTRTLTTTTTTTTDRRFGSHLLENGVIFGGPDAIAPDDHDKIKAALANEQKLPATAHRNWLSIKESVYRSTWGELSLESKIIESLLGHYEYPLFYERFRNEQWTEVDNEITAGISDPKPDVTESYMLKAYPPGTMDEFEELIPTQYAYAMPTFAMESKGAGDTQQALMQAAYDGAVMTHAAIVAEYQMSKDEEQLYSKTKAITVTLNPQEICVHANHAVKDPETGKVTYHQYCVERLLYSLSEKNWNAAHSVLRNAQLFALKLADTRIQEIQVYFDEKAKKMENLKVKNNELQVQARAGTNPNMKPSPKYTSTVKPSRPSLQATDNATKPAIKKNNSIRQQTTNIQSKVGSSSKPAFNEVRKISQPSLSAKSKFNPGPTIDDISRRAVSSGIEIDSQRPACKSNKISRQSKGTEFGVNPGHATNRTSLIGDIVASIDKQVSPV